MVAKWTRREECALCCVWLSKHETYDRIRGFWDDVREVLAQEHDVHRKNKALTSRWGKMVTDITRFHDCLMRVGGSKVPNARKVALRMYEETTGSKFTLLHCWKVLRGSTTFGPDWHVLKSKHSDDNKMSRSAVHKAIRERVQPQPMQRKTSVQLKRQHEERNQTMPLAPESKKLKPSSPLLSDQEHSYLQYVEADEEGNTTDCDFKAARDSAPLPPLMSPWPLGLAMFAPPPPMEDPATTKFFTLARQHLLRKMHLYQQVKPRATSAA